MSFSTRTTLPARSISKAGSAGGQRLRLRVHAPKPHEQGAWALRFSPDGAVVRVDGERPTRRGRSPAAFWGMGRRRFGRVGGALGNAGNAKFGGSAVFVCFAVWALRSLEFGRSKFGTWELKWIWGRAPADLTIWKLENWALGGQALGGLATWRLWGLGGLGARGFEGLGGLGGDAACATLFPSCNSFAYAAANGRVRGSIYPIEDTG